MEGRSNRDATGSIPERGQFKRRIRSDHIRKSGFLQKIDQICRAGCRADVCKLVQDVGLSGRFEEGGEEGEDFRDGDPGAEGEEMEG